MVWRFLKHYGMNKAGDLLDDFASAVVAFDPKVASRAQVALMEAELKKLGNRLAEAEAEVHREHRETLALKKSYQQYLQAAHLLDAKLSEANDPAEASETEASLVRLIEKLEEMKPEIAREELEDQEVEAWRCEVRRAFEELAEKTRSAGARLKTAQRQMEVVKLQKERAEERDLRYREAAGLTGSISSLSVALDAMNQETSRVRAETEVLKMKSGLWQSAPLDSDPKIAAALASVRGQAAVDRQSLSQRLAALDEPLDGPHFLPAA